MARKTDRRLAPGVKGRPRQEIPPDAAVYRQRFGAPPEALARLDDLATASRRTVPAELAVALERYLARQEVPTPSLIDPAHGKTRAVLPADLLRTLDARYGIDHREEHIAAALSWWVETGHRKR